MNYVFIFIIGAIVGSFINVILSRHDWYKGRSHCDSCGYTLSPIDLVPIISFIVFGGRCRKCRARIDTAHFISELFMGMSFLCSYVICERTGLQNGIVCAIAVFVMTVAAIEDYKEQLVYAWILNAGIATTLVVKLIVNICYDEPKAAIATLVSVLVFTILVKLLGKLISDKLGNGDLDLLIIMYMICGGYGTLVAVTLSCIIGCLVYLPPILLKRLDKSEPIPFAPFLLMGTLLCKVI